MLHSEINNNSSCNFDENVKFSKYVVLILVDSTLRSKIIRNPIYIYFAPIAQCGSGLG